MTFKVFGVYFGSPARSVTIQTTIRGEQGLDPVELWAFDTNGDRVWTRSATRFSERAEVLGPALEGRAFHLTSEWNADIFHWDA